MHAIIGPMISTKCPGCISSSPCVRSARMINHTIRHPCPIMPITHTTKPNCTDRLRAYVLSTITPIKNAPKVAMVVRSFKPRNATLGNAINFARMHANIRSASTRKTPCANGACAASKFPIDALASITPPSGSGVCSIRCKKRTIITWFLVATSA